MFRPLRPVRSLADIEAIEATPLAELIRPQSTYALFDAAARDNGQGMALSFVADAQTGEATVRYTYAQLLARIHQVANALHGLGVGPGDAVGILLPGCAEYHLALWGGSAAGVVQPLNPLLTPEKISALLNATGAKVLIAWADADDAGIWAKVASLSAGIEHVLYVSHAGTAPDTTGIRAQVQSLQALIDAQPDDGLVSGRVIQASDAAAHFHTGGTTGSPKLATQTHGAQVYTAWASVQMQGLTHADRTINGYPLFHVAGVLPGALACFSAGAEVIIPTTGLFRNKAVITHFWQLVERYRPTFMSGVPTVLSLLADIELKGADISSLRYVRTGAAPLNEDVAQRFKARTGLHIHESLGMTEMTGISTVTPPGVVASVGHVGMRLPHARIRIARLDADGRYDEPAAPGEAGMVLFDSPNVFVGYLGQTATAQAFTADGWLISGDIGSMSPDGLLKLRGRAKDVIIRSGHNIDPLVIEQALESHPAVRACAAVGAPDPHAGEVPVAFVTLHEGASVDEEALRAFAAQHVDEPPARPRQVRILDAMPTTNVGKVFKPALRDMTVADYVRGVLTADLAAQGVPAQRWPQVSVTPQGIRVRDAHGVIAPSTVHAWQARLAFLKAELVFAAG